MKVLPCGILVDNDPQKGLRCVYRETTAGSSIQSRQQISLFFRSNACLVWSGYKSEREEGWGSSLTIAKLRGPALLLARNTKRHPRRHS